MALSRAVMTHSSSRKFRLVAVFIGSGFFCGLPCIAAETARPNQAPPEVESQVARYLDEEWRQKLGMLSQQIAADPQNAALLVTRGEVLLKARLLDGRYDFQGALLDFQKATELNPKNLAAWVGMARATTPVALEPEGTQITAPPPSDADLRQKKRDYLQKALDLDPKFAPALAEMGWIAWEEATGGRAPISRVAAIAKPSPESVEQLKTAQTFAEEAIQIAPRSGRSWLLKAEILADSNRAREALEAYKTALSFDAISAQEALQMRVDALDAMGDSADALLYLAALEALDGPLSPDFYALRARAKFRLQDWEGAAADVDKAVEVAGKGARKAAMLVLRGQLKLRQNDAAGAKTDFEAAYAADPKNLDALDVLRQIYAAQGQFAASIQVSNQLLEQRNDAHQVRFLLAMLLAFTGDLGGSKTAYEASIGKISRRDVENQLQDVTKNLGKAPSFEPLLQAQKILQEELAKRG